MMEPDVKSTRLRIAGMTCASCRNKIEKKLRSTAGIQSAKVDFSAGTADIVYDAGKITISGMSALISKLGYQVLAEKRGQHPRLGRVIAILAVTLVLYVLLQQFGILNLLVPSQLANTQMWYGMLFVIGLVTSIHCVTMCGGISLSLCIPQGGVANEKGSRFGTFVPAFFYNLGRVISYTAIGFVLGFVGSLMGGGSEVGLPAVLQGILKLIAGVFMVIVGINMLGIFPWLRRLQPRLPKSLVRIIGTEKPRGGNPLLVGLLNGLMPCGPLQSMQIVALASANPLSGALSMFVFSVGTVPLLLGLGSAVSALGKRFAQKVMSVGAVLVVVLGLAMLSQGGSLSGLLPPNVMLPLILALATLGVISAMPYRQPSWRAVSTAGALAAILLLFAVGGLKGFDGTGNETVAGTSAAGSNATNSAAGSATNGTQITEGRQVITSKLASGRYPNITVQAGTPVKWIIEAPKGSINGCNYKMYIPDYSVVHTFKIGENILSFTPDKAGTVRYSCWMGMIHGTITVTAAKTDSN